MYPQARTPGKAQVAVMVAPVMPPPPRPNRTDPTTRRFSKFKPFGLKLCLKYKQIGDFDKEGEDTIGINFQIWAQGED